jgi:hypothetical protein
VVSVNKVQGLLLNDAQAVLQAIVTSTGNQALDEVFAYWLVPNVANREFVLSAIAKAATASGAQRTYQEVAILGYGTEITDITEEYISLLNTGLELLSGREPISEGVPMGFVVDGIAMLGIAIGAARAKSNSKTKEKISAWIERCSNARAMASVPDWQRTLLTAAEIKSGFKVLESSAHEPDGFDVRVMLRAKGIFSSVDLVEEDEVKLVSTLQRQSSCELSKCRAAIRLFGLDFVRSKSPTVAMNRLTASDVGNILRRIEPALRNWTWEEKPRTTKKGAEARKWHVENEYHVQNLLWLVLAPLFPDLQDEEYTPKIGTLQPRADIPIPSLQLIVEVKFWRADASSQEMIRQLAQDNSLYSVSGSRYKQIIAFIWDNAGRTEQHDLLIQGLCKLDRVVDAVVVSRPSMMVEIEKRLPDSDADKRTESKNKEDGDNNK